MRVKCEIVSFRGFAYQRRPPIVLAFNPECKENDVLFRFFIVVHCFWPLSSLKPLYGEIQEFPYTIKYGSISDGSLHPESFQT